MSTSFLEVAPYYDELMSGVPYDMWVGYYLLLLAEQAFDPTRVLDVCCGTGTMSEKLQVLGYEMTGVDLSVPMIEAANAKGLDAKFFACDAAQMELGKTFDAAFSFFDSFNYITDLGQLGKVFQRVSDHLIPDGSFIFDLNTAYAFESKMFDQKDTRKKTHLKYDWHGEYDAISRMIAVHMDFWVDERHFVEVHHQRAHSKEEITELLKKAGFGSIEIFESYTLEKPRKRTDRVHYAAKKLT